MKSLRTHWGVMLGVVAILGLAVVIRFGVVRHALRAAPKATRSLTASEQLIAVTGPPPAPPPVILDDDGHQFQGKLYAWTSPDTRQSVNTNPNAVVVWPPLVYGGSPESQHCPQNHGIPTAYLRR